MSSGADPTTPRQHVLAALEFRDPGVMPVEYHASPAGSYEHGARLAALWAQYVDDFGPPQRFPLCQPPHDAVDGEGRYHEVLTDEWGVVRGHLVFGASGFPIEQPLSDWSHLARFRPPALPPDSGPVFEAERERVERHRERYFLKSGWISLFELMHSLRDFGDVLADIAMDRPEIHRLADLLVEHHAARIRYLLQRGVDAIQFGDDFGTQTGLVMSPKMWRAFFRPRYEHLVRLAHEGGAKVFFHSCGCVRALLEDLVALQVDAIWPQLSAYDTASLARFCRESRLPIALHPDRGEVMIRSAPEQVRTYVLRLAEAFDVDRGGAWFYVEIDAGFPFDNVRALIATIASLRGTGETERGEP